MHQGLKTVDLPTLQLKDIALPTAAIAGMILAAAISMFKDLDKWLLACNINFPYFSLITSSTKLQYSVLLVGLFDGMPTATNAAKISHRRLRSAYSAVLGP